MSGNATYQELASAFYFLCDRLASTMIILPHDVTLPNICSVDFDVRQSVLLYDA